MSELSYTIPLGFAAAVGEPIFRFGSQVFLFRVEDFSQPSLDFRRAK